MTPGPRPVKRLVVAVDGPAAAGKGTLAKALAAALDLPHLDTGLLYRAVARRLLDAGVPLDGPAAVALPEAVVSAAVSAARNLSPADLSRTDLRTPEMDRAASRVSALPPVRAALLDAQRDFAAAHGAVLDGRDIGTVIFPDAPVKLFVSASPRTRAERRWRQLHGDAVPPSFPDPDPIAAVEAAIAARDAADASRALSPLRPAADAVHLHTDGLDAAAVLAEALRIVRARWPARFPENP